MSKNGKDVKLSLKVMINKEKTKVLFAEADNDFANVLLSFLTFPLGRIAKILEKHYADEAPVFGSITSLYKSLANLDDTLFSTTAAKLMLLDPKSCSDSICRNLKIDISSSIETKYFGCGSCVSAYPLNTILFMYYGGAATCQCGRPLNTEVSVGDSEEYAGVFTIKNLSCIISDDLRMAPYSEGIFQTLSNLGVGAAEAAELWNVSLGTDEIMDLLKCCLLSENPLTDVILNNGEIVSCAVKPETRCHIAKEGTRSCKEITLRVMVHKSTNKVLFAKADDDFIELLCSFLIIPIGGVESLLDTDTRLKNLDNLFRSVSDVSLDKYFGNLHAQKIRLTSPSVPPFFKPENTIFSLIEEAGLKVYYNFYNTQKKLSHILTQKVRSLDIPIKSPKGDGNYVMGPKTFMVTDDLTVTPFCMSSFFSILNRLNIPFSDVNELEVRIGLQEGLSILRASLTSTSALTDGLFNHIMKKQPKQEHHRSKKKPKQEH